MCKGRAVVGGGTNQLWVRVGIEILCLVFHFFRLLDLVCKLDNAVVEVSPFFGGLHSHIFLNAHVWKKELFYAFKWWYGSPGSF